MRERLDTQRETCDHNQFVQMLNTNDLQCDRYTAMLKRLFNVPYTFLYLIDDKSCFLKSYHGKFHYKFSRDDPFIAPHVLSDSPDVFISNNLEEDLLYCSHPIVQSNNHSIRFFAGTSLSVLGQKIGILGMLDYVDRTSLSLDEKANLLDLGVTVSGILYDQWCDASTDMNERASIITSAVMNLKNDTAHLSHTVNKLKYHKLMKNHSSSKANSPETSGKQEKNHDTCNVSKVGLSSATDQLYSNTQFFELILSSTERIYERCLRNFKDEKNLLASIPTNIQSVYQKIYTLSNSVFTSCNHSKDINLQETNELESINPQTQFESSHESNVSSNKVLSESHFNYQSRRKLIRWELDESSFLNSCNQLFYDDLLSYSVTSLLCRLIDDWDSINIHLSYCDKNSSRMNVPGNIEDIIEGDVQQDLTSHPLSIDQNQLIVKDGQIHLEGVICCDIQVYCPVPQVSTIDRSVSINPITSLHLKDLYSIETFLRDIGGSLEKARISESSKRIHDRDTTGILYSISQPCYLINPMLSLSSNICMNTKGINFLNHDTNQQNDKGETADLSVGQQQRLLNVLIVDDSLAHQKIMKSYINPSKSNIVTLSNGKQALKYLYSNPVDIIFVDILMPVMNGLEMLEKLNCLPQSNFSRTTSRMNSAMPSRSPSQVTSPISSMSLHRHRPLIIAMAHTCTSDIAEKIFQYGAQYLMIKPIAESDVNKVIEIAYECSTTEETILRIQATISNSNRNYFANNLSFQDSGSIVLNESTNNLTMDKNRNGISSKVPDKFVFRLPSPTVTISQVNTNKTIEFNEKRQVSDAEVSKEVETAFITTKKQSIHNDHDTVDNTDIDTLQSSPAFAFTRRRSAAAVRDHKNAEDEELPVIVSRRSFLRMFSLNRVLPI